MALDLSAIVVSYNTSGLLASCLRSVGETATGLAYELIVVDNGSRDGSVEMVMRDFPHVRLIRNQDNRGFAAASNQAIRASLGRHVLLLNSDAALLPGTADRMVSFLDGHPQVGVVGGLLLNPDGSFQASYADFPGLSGELLLLTKLARVFRSPAYPSYPEEKSREPRAVDWVPGACLMARRAAIDAVGYLDEDYFMYAEETDWCYRMRQAGWLVYYLPDAKTIHWSGQSAGRAPERKRLQVYRSKWLFMRKHRGALAAATFRLVVRLASAAKLVAWALTAATPDRARRERALLHVRSYALLLNEL